MSKKKNIFKDRSIRIILGITGFFLLGVIGCLIALLVEWNQGVSHDASDPLEIGLGFAVFYTICGLIIFIIRALSLTNKSKIAIDSDEEVMQEETITCPECGKITEHNAKFCSECGHAFKESKEKGTLPIQTVSYQDSYTLGMSYLSDFHSMKFLYLIILVLYVIALAPLIAFIIIKAPLVRTYTIAMIIIAVIMLTIFLILPLSDHQSKKKNDTKIAVLQDKIAIIRNSDSSTNIRVFHYQNIVKAVDKKNYYLFRYRGTKNNLHSFCLPKRGLSKETVDFLNTLIK